MKFNITHAFVGIGVLVALWAVQRKVKAGTSSPSTHNSETAQSPGQWWTYAGQWSAR